MVYRSVPSQTAFAIPADAVLGQASFTTNASSIAANGYNFISGVRSGADKFVVADSNRVLIYNSLPTFGNPLADVAVGAINTSTDGTSSCTASTFVSVASVAIGGSKLLVADAAGKRVLVYNSIPAVSGASADLVLGETSLTNCAGGISASLMTGPIDVWSDGKRVVVADTNRVLFWNTFPTISGQPADLVLGQPSMTTNAANNGGISSKSLYLASGVTSDGTRLLVTDSLNNRILVWNQFPTSSQQAADVVLGQNDFVSRVAATTASGLRQPNSVAVDQSHILAVDSLNNRVMIWYGQ